MKIYGKKPLKLKIYNAIKSFLSGWFIPNQYITLPVNEVIKGLDKSEEEQ